VVVDLEDAVSVDQKDAARANVESLTSRPHGQLAVRVNAIGSRWHRADVAACAANPAVDSIVVPKAEDPDALAALARTLHCQENGNGRRSPLRIQALIESPLGVRNAEAIAASSAQMTSLVIGYADLSASFGRRVDASWQYVRDVVQLAARLAGTEVVDGPVLGIAVDDALREAAALAAAQGLDGKWVIHPAQVATVQAAFTPTDDEVAEAREVVRVMQESAAQGLGAVQWRGQMLDEAVVVRAQRLLDRTDTHRSAG
jgi:citrate lyase beta subunit